VAGGHCLIFGCPHNTGSSTVAALVCWPVLPILTGQVTIYGSSTWWHRQPSVDRILKRLANRELPASILKVAAQEAGRGGEGRQSVVLTF
jgi:hypothetical protein